MKNRSSLAISNSLKDTRTSLWRIAENKSVSAGLSESSDAPDIPSSTNSRTIRHFADFAHFSTASRCWGKDRAPSHQQNRVRRPV